MQTIDPQARAGSEGVRDEQISLAHVLAILRSYRRSIATVLAAVAIGYLLVAVALYLFGPSKEITTLPFRVVFEGADQNRYPNGTPFNSTEITATPVLQSVYASARLQPFVTFTDLKNSIFVVEQNKELDRLSLEYNARLADPKLSPVDRERVEREYDLRKESIRRTDYALNFVVDDRTSAIPRDIRIQVLKSVLDTWAEQAMNEKGAGRYRIPALSRNILAPETALEGRDYIVTIDILRTKANRIIATIDQMLAIPGAEVLATGKERITLPEVRVNLEDTRRFRLEPLMATLRTHSGHRRAMEFVQAQLDSARRRRDQERLRVDTLQRSLDTYMQRAFTHSASSATSPGISGTQVIPQVDKSFLDQISELVAQKRDVEYRQRLIDDLNRAAIGQLLPAESEVNYYETLVQSMKNAPDGTGSPQVDAAIRDEYARAAQEVYRAVDQVTDLYRLLSRNLNPGLSVYTLTETSRRTSARAFSIPRLIAYGVLLMVIVLPLVLFGALIHNRIREEEVEEARMARAQ